MNSKRTTTVPSSGHNPATATRGTPATAVPSIELLRGEHLDFRLGLFETGGPGDRIVVDGVVAQREVEHQGEHDTAVPGVSIRNRGLFFQEQVDSAGGRLAQPQFRLSRQDQVAKFAAIEIFPPWRQVGAQLDILQPRGGEPRNGALGREGGSEPGGDAAVGKLLAQPLFRGPLVGAGGCDFANPVVPVSLACLGPDRAGDSGNRSDVPVGSDLHLVSPAHRWPP